jgi:hypothetical protein
LLPTTGANLPGGRAVARDGAVVENRDHSVPVARNRLPEKHTKKYDNQDAKDEATPTGTAGVIVLGGQPVGIAHVEANWTGPEAQ